MRVPAGGADRRRASAARLLSRPARSGTQGRRASARSTLFDLLRSLVRWSSSSCIRLDKSSRLVELQSQSDPRSLRERNLSRSSAVLASRASSAQRSACDDILGIAWHLDLHRDASLVAGVRKFFDLPKCEVRQSGSRAPQQEARPHSHSRASLSLRGADCQWLG